MERNDNVISIGPLPERIKEGRIARGFTQVDLANRVGVTRQAISLYEQGQAIPSPKVMDVMVQALGLPLRFFQVKREHSEFERITSYRAPKRATQLNKEVESVRATWLEDLYHNIERYIAFPESKIPPIVRFNKERLSHEKIEKIAKDLRRLWGLQDGPISNLTLLLEKAGVVICKANLIDPKIDGYSWYNPSYGRHFTIVNASVHSAARDRLNLAHELGHMLLHSVSENVSETVKEEEAFDFAAAFLLPKETFLHEVMSASLDHFVTLKRRWRVSIQAMVKRCHTLGLFDDDLFVRLHKQLAIRRWKTCEPLDEEVPVEKPVLLNQAIELLIENGVQSIEELSESTLLPIADIEMCLSVPEGTFTKNKKMLPLTLIKG